MPLTADRVSAPQLRQGALAGERLVALDWVKGALVVFMVIYHTINYSSFRPLAFQYLAFLPPSFIVITGYLVGLIYATRYRLDSWQPYARVAVRGFKLLALFTVLNLALLIATERSFFHGFWEFIERAQAIYLYGSGRVAIFEVLLPIAYFLILAPALLAVGRVMKWGPAALAAGAFTVCIWMERRGLPIEHAGLLTAGLIGMALSCFNIQSLNRLVARSWIVLACYTAYRVLSHIVGETYAVQTCGAVVTLVVLYWIATRCLSEGPAYSQMVLLGRYSLLAYLVQIALLQVLVRAIGGMPRTALPVIGLGIATLLLTWAITVGIDTLRKRATVTDKAYRFVFA